MNRLEAYIDFRKTIDTMFFPEFEKNCDISTIEDDQGETIAMLIDEGGYIDCLWVEENHRNQGIGYQLVVKHVLEYGMPWGLRILHNNPKAKEFWNKVFVLEAEESNEYDNLYNINGFKERK